MLSRQAAPTPDAYDIAFDRHLAAGLTREAAQDAAAAECGVTECFHCGSWTVENGACIDCKLPGCPCKGTRLADGRRCESNASCLDDGERSCHCCSCEVDRAERERYWRQRYDGECVAGLVRS